MGKLIRFSFEEEKEQVGKTLATGAARRGHNLGEEMSWRLLWRRPHTNAILRNRELAFIND